MTAVRRSAPTRVLRPNVFIQRIVCGQQIFNKQLFTGLDRPERVDEDAASVFDRLAVGRACVIKPSCAVATAAAVDDPPVRQTKKERVSLDAFTPVSANGIAPRSDFTLVFKHALARREWSHRKHALAMNWRPPDDHTPHAVLLTDIRISIEAANFHIHRFVRASRSQSGGPAREIEVGEVGRRDHP